MRTDVRTAAQGKWVGILSSFGMTDKALSGKHTACPMCGGKDRFRFDNKDGRGTYFCSGCGAGDGVTLSLHLTGQPFAETARRIEELSGVALPTISKPERSEADKLTALRRLYQESRPIVRGDEVCCYLAGRGIELYDLPHNLRFHPSLRYKDEFAEACYPAMLATITAPDGKAVSIHRTYLHEGRKAPVASPKRLMPGLPIAGGAVRLTPVSEVLGVAEGIETALAASRLFEIPVWSCISANGLESFIPPEGVKEVVIFADNDVSFTGQAAAYSLAKRLTLKGYETEVQIPSEQGDWLDEL